MTTCMPACTTRLGDRFCSFLSSELRLAHSSNAAACQTRRAHIQPAGVQDLKDQLEIANEVRATLCADIARLTEELVQAKLMSAQEQSDREVMEHKLLRAEERCRSVALRMTKLEVRLCARANALCAVISSVELAHPLTWQVQLSEYQNSAAENDELKANAFMEAMQYQVGSCPHDPVRCHMSKNVDSLLAGAQDTRARRAAYGVAWREERWLAQMRAGPWRITGSDPSKK